MTSPSIPKRIIVCCDGTWYASDKGGNNLPSNVARISRSLAKVGIIEHGPQTGEKIGQVVCYQSGVGTGNLGVLDKAWQGAFGASLNENVCEAYNFLATNWAPGDEIFLFGFSRGAFTARSVAGLICDAGLLKPHAMDLFFGMYEAYRGRRPAAGGKEAQKLEDTKWAKELWKNEDGEYEKKFGGAEKTNWDIYKEGIQNDVQIKVVGVWDTVGSLGVPENVVTRWLGTNEHHKFHNTSLHPNIHHAFHALALDEHRGAFSPTLWYVPEGKTYKDNKLVQCWFPGYHASVGGGTTGPGTANDEGDIDEIAFAWMLDLVKPFLTFDRTAISKIFPTDIRMPKRTLTSGLAPVNKPSMPAPKPNTTEDYEHIRTQSWGMSIMEDTYGASWSIAGGSQVRTPKEIKPLGSDGLPVQNANTREYMHPCVYYRMVGAGSQYRPESLKTEVKKGWFVKEEVVSEWKHEEVSKGDGKGFQWVKYKGSEKVVQIDEYVVPNYGSSDGIGSLERLLIPLKVQKELDEGNRNVEWTV
ncbi:hypothetical protein B7494_g4572 [Chlorociboria aeruginascens]|nr:hypothetical protein B7494_g4572 [Chlorociboria aeruginascens]